MTINLDTLRKRAELPNALHGCTSNPCGSVVCQTARDRDELLSRVEQAELERDEWRGKFDESETAHIHSDAQVDRVREVLSEVQARGEKIRAKGSNGSIYQQERAARGEGYLEATRLAFRALDGDTRG